MSAAIDGFELSDADAPLAAEICHRLDGIPLAIELATGRVDALGLRGLATALHDRFQVLTANRRTALPRHRTLGATLDWSWDFLPEGERIILRRLAVFDWYFTQESALRIIGTSEMAACDVMEGVANLVAKSLVVADITGEDVHYRLLGVTRAYALEKLRESGELDEAMDRQARDRQEVLARAGLGPDGKPLMGRT